MIFLKGLSVNGGEVSKYPFNKPNINAANLTFDTSVTLFVGENGSGKSTLLEALARKLKLPSIGAQDASEDNSLSTLHSLCGAMRLRWVKITHHGFFLRSEDFFNFTHRMTRLRQEMLDELHRIDDEYEGRSSYAKGLARMPFAGSLAEIEKRYGIDLDAQSHGESFIKLFNARFSAGGLYLLDEPEAPLSPLRQLSLISMIREQEAKSQFIIATHSPILLAYPGARIYNLDEDPISTSAFNDLEHVKLMRDFLIAPERYIRHL